MKYINVISQMPWQKGATACSRCPVWCSREVREASSFGPRKVDVSAEDIAGRKWCNRQSHGNWVGWSRRPFLHSGSGGRRHQVGGRFLQILRASACVRMTIAHARAGSLWLDCAPSLILGPVQNVKYLDIRETCGGVGMPHTHTHDHYWVQCA